MTTTIYSFYTDLPAYKDAQEQLIKVKEIYELAVQEIKDKFKKEELKFVEERDSHRKNAKWEYIMKEPVINEFGKHYHITRKALNPQIGDTEFYKDIDYGSFKIVNNVFISTGGGHQFQQVKTGDIISDEELMLLNTLTVPERFKNKPVFTENNLYYLGT